MDRASGSSSPSIALCDAAGRRSSRVSPQLRRLEGEGGGAHRRWPAAPLPEGAAGQLSLWSSLQVVHNRP